MAKWLNPVCVVTASWNVSQEEIFVPDSCDGNPETSLNITTVGRVAKLRSKFDIRSLWWFWLKKLHLVTAQQMSGSQIVLLTNQPMWTKIISGLLASATQWSKTCSSDQCTFLSFAMQQESFWATWLHSPLNLACGGVPNLLFWMVIVHQVCWDHCNANTVTIRRLLSNHVIFPTKSPSKVPTNSATKDGMDWSNWVDWSNHTWRTGHIDDEPSGESTTAEAGGVEEPAVAEVTATDEALMETLSTEAPTTVSKFSWQWLMQWNQQSSRDNICGMFAPIAGLLQFQHTLAAHARQSFTDFHFQWLHCCSPRCTWILAIRQNKTKQNKTKQNKTKQNKCIHPLAPLELKPGSKGTLGSGSGDQLVTIFWFGSVWSRHQSNKCSTMCSPRLTNCVKRRFEWLTTKQLVSTSNAIRIVKVVVNARWFVQQAKVTANWQANFQLPEHWCPQGFAFGVRVEAQGWKSGLKVRVPSGGIARCIGWTLEITSQHPPWSHPWVHKWWINCSVPSSACNAQHGDSGQVVCSDHQMDLKFWLSSSWMQTVQFSNLVSWTSKCPSVWSSQWDIDCHSWSEAQPGCQCKSLWDPPEEIQAPAEWTSNVWQSFPHHVQQWTLSLSGTTSSWSLSLGLVADGRSCMSEDKPRDKPSFPKITATTGIHKSHQSWLVDVNIKLSNSFGQGSRLLTVRVRWTRQLFVFRSGKRCAPTFGNLQVSGHTLQQFAMMFWGRTGKLGHGHCSTGCVWPWGGHWAHHFAWQHPVLKSLLLFKCGVLCWPFLGSCLGEQLGEAIRWWWRHKVTICLSIFASGLGIRRLSFPTMSLQHPFNMTLWRQQNGVLELRHITSIVVCNCSFKCNGKFFLMLEPNMFSCSFGDWFSSGLILGSCQNVVNLSWWEDSLSLLGNFLVCASVVSGSGESQLVKWDVVNHLHPLLATKWVSL